MSKDTATPGAAKGAVEDRRLDPISEAKRQWEANGWVDAAEGMAAVTTIVRVNQIVTSHVEEVLAPFGLSFARFEILRLLGFTRQGQLPMGKIGERLQVHPASVTSAVKRLERDGLVERASSDADSRVVLAAITEEGQRVLAPATEAVNGVFRRVGEVREMEHLTEALNAIRRSAGDPVA